MSATYGLAAGTRHGTLDPDARWLKHHLFWLVTSSTKRRDERRYYLSLVQSCVCVHRQLLQSAHLGSTPDIIVYITC